MEQYVIKIQELIPALARTADLFLPEPPKTREHDGYADVVEAAYYRFAPWDEKTIDLGSYRTTRVPIKELLFPQSETLYRYGGVKDGQVISEPVSMKDRIVLGVRPCDCAALVRLDAVFETEPVDDRYHARRARLVVIGLACTAPAQPTCFCTSVGVSPDSTEGMDIRATALDNDDVLLEPLTEKGMALMDKLDKQPLRKAIQEQEDRARNARLAAAAAVPTYALQTRALTFGGPLWRREAATCLGCGTCTFLCPTCHCFTIEHLGSKLHKRMIRSWDSCQFPAYSLEASGFNPRPLKEDRMRQRILHKFKYYPESHRGSLMCVGCGRCVSLCPAGIDLREILENAPRHSSGGKSDDNT